MPIRMAIIKKSTSNQCWTGCGEKGTFLKNVVGNATWYSHYGEQHGDSLKSWNYHKTKQSHTWAYT